MLAAGTSTTRAEDPPEPQPPVIAPASAEGHRALQGFAVAPGLQGQLFAAEPEVANPVAFYVDGGGRVFVCESFRQNQGVTDNRGHDQAWLDDDLAARTVEDRLAYHRKHLKEKVSEYTQQDDRIRLLEDRDADGQADHSTVFADRFNGIVDGTGAGVLAYRGRVYYTCIPHLWLLEDKDGDGRADARQSLAYGFGVRVAFRGHDMHGLCLGPDGRLYFSIGDRGYHVETPEGVLSDPESGAVFRCELDGTRLEVVATGLRNPQELAFDDWGNLFTGDNNSDSGDRARLVQIVDGSDTGWRMAYQYLPDRGPFNREKIWHPQHDSQPAYIVPPIANFADGPSGLAFYPGVGMPEDFRGRFFLCDFRGGPANSGIRSFRLKPQGAFFELADTAQPVWQILATDVDFGPDGALYVSDWVNGWNGEGKGRIYRFTAAETSGPLAQETRKLLAEGLSHLSASELQKLLGHADRRVRQEAQFALVDRMSADELEASARSHGELLGRMHAVWGLGQLIRKGTVPAALATLESLLGDPQAEVRAQAVKVLGESVSRPASEPLLRLLSDSEPRVRAMAALSLGRLQIADAFPAVVKLLAENAGSDPILRHCGIMALAGIGSSEQLTGLRSHGFTEVRLAAVVALRRQQRPEIAVYLDDHDPRVVVEAARAIHDLPLPAAWPRLASLVERPGSDEALLRRVLNANYRLGEVEHAEALAAFAARSTTPAAMRVEALQLLSAWARPSPRDRVLGMWRPLPPREGSLATHAVRRSLGGILSGPEPVRVAGARIAAELGIREAASTLRELLADSRQTSRTRRDALAGLAQLGDEQLSSAVATALEDEDSSLRAQALGILATIDSAAALPALERAVEQGEVAERQQAFATLAALPQREAATIIEQALDRLVLDKVPLDTQLDVLTAARQRNEPALQEKLRRYEAERADGEATAQYRESLEGGNAERGALIFFERTEVSCVRCHKVGDRGGEVGPDLSQIGKDKNRQYLLEAIVDPNRAIAKGYESATIADDEGRVHVGVVRHEDEHLVRLITAEGKTIEIPKDRIDDRAPAKSAMPEDVIKKLSRSDLRDLVEFLSSQKGSSDPGRPL